MNAQYEDETLQAMALSVIPEDELQAAADAAIAQSRENGDSPVLAQQDAFARQLLMWFKRDFFSWVRHIALLRTIAVHSTAWNWICLRFFSLPFLLQSSSPPQKSRWQKPLKVRQN